MRNGVTSTLACTCFTSPHRKITLFAQNYYLLNFLFPLVYYLFYSDTTKLVYRNTTVNKITNDAFSSSIKREISIKNANHTNYFELVKVLFTIQLCLPPYASRPPMEA